jgi:hypothetical protein
MAWMRRIALISAPLALLVLAGCGSKGSTTAPAACLEPVSQYLTALQAAPEPVRLPGDTAISECFTGAESPEIGRTAIKAATLLNAQARRDPGGPATVSLGYLNGAVREGASRTGGAEEDLVRRLETAARFNPRGGVLGATFERAFGKGYAAGEATG